ncbi:YrdB family protein [Microbacterium sp.]|uniref:YrdB family protein n=1 Tax=Microbacterium sp. TaxID=51671 RepID=UPI003A840FCC
MAHPAPTSPPPRGTAGTVPALSVIDLIVALCGLFAVVTFAIWGFTAWTAPWNVVAGIVTPLVAVLIWALFLSPRAVVNVHPFLRAFVELCFYAGATIAWWSAGQAWIGLAFAIVSVPVGLVAGLRRIA